MNLKSAVLGNPKTSTIGGLALLLGAFGIEVDQQQAAVLSDIISQNAGLIAVLLVGVQGLFSRDGDKDPEPAGSGKEDE